MTPKKTPTKRSNGAAKSTKTRTRKTPAAPLAGKVRPTLTNEDIARHAYALWESRGRPVGSPDEDWHRAKEQLTERSRKA